MNFSRPAADLMLIPLLAGLILGVGSPALAVESDGSSVEETVVEPGNVDGLSESEGDADSNTAIDELDDSQPAPALSEEPAIGGATADAPTAPDSPRAPEPLAEAPAQLDAPGTAADADTDADAVPSLLDELLRQDVPGATAAAPGGAQAKGAQNRSLKPGSIYNGNFPDPYILPVAENGGTTYYAYSTNAHYRNLPVLKSSDLKTWTVTSYSSDMGWADRNWASDYNPFNDQSIPAEIRSFDYRAMDITPEDKAREAWLNADGAVSPRPSWALKVSQNMENGDDYGWSSHESWAPAVAKLNGRYVAYMSVRASSKKSSERFCIAMATSSSPAGPFRASPSSSPVVCPTDRVNGVIDPEPFQYQGKWYLLWKSENSPGKPQGLHAQRLNPATGRLMAGTKPVDLLLRDGSANAWEQHAIENPSMVTISGTTYLFYSSGRFWASGDATSQYSTDYAICPKGPTAPCSRAEGDNRLLASVGSVQGPGGGSVFKAANGSWKFAYHAYQRNGSPYDRQLRIANIYRWPSGAVAIADGKKPRFADVPAHQQFHQHIMWLAGKGITTGDKNSNFRPLGSTSRADMAAFLYRYAGSPNYTPRGVEPFADVNKSTKFYKEIRWMHTKGLSTGVRNTTGGKPRYVPQAAITREAMAAFFYRLSGAKGYAPKGKEPLVDVNRKSKFYREIRWMYDNGITTGISMGGGKYRFNEYSQTNRDAFAAFLLRYDGK